MKIARKSEYGVVFSIIALMLIFGFNEKVFAAKKLVVGYLQFPPIEYNENGQHKGFCLDIVKRVFEEEGVDYSFKYLPPKRLYKNLAEGKTDVWPGIKGVPIHKNTTVACDFLLGTIFVQVYSVGNKKAIKSIKGLNNKFVLLIRGYSYGGLIRDIKDPKNNIKYHETDSHESAFKMLKAKRADYLLEYYKPSKKVLKKITIKNLKVSTIRKVNLYLLLSKKTKNYKKLRLKIDKSFDRLYKTDNDFKKLVNTTRNI